jgi:hypothetical protein
MPPNHSSGQPMVSFLASAQCGLALAAAYPLGRKRRIQKEIIKGGIRDE